MHERATPDARGPSRSFMPGRVPFQVRRSPPSAFPTELSSPSRDFMSTQLAVPRCRVHSYYLRSPAGLPISDQSVRLCLRRFRYLNDKEQAPPVCQAAPEVVSCIPDAKTRRPVAIQMVVFKRPRPPCERPLHRRMEGCALDIGSQTNAPPTIRRTSFWTHLKSPFRTSHTPCPRRRPATRRGF